MQSTTGYRVYFFVLVAFVYLFYVFILFIKQVVRHFECSLVRFFTNSCHYFFGSMIDKWRDKTSIWFCYCFLLSSFLLHSLVELTWNLADRDTVSGESVCVCVYEWVCKWIVHWFFHWCSCILRICLHLLLLFMLSFMLSVCVTKWIAMLLCHGHCSLFFVLLLFSLSLR